MGLYKAPNGSVFSMVHETIDGACNTGRTSTSACSHRVFKQDAILHVFGGSGRGKTGKREKREDMETGEYSQYEQGSQTSRHLCKNPPPIRSSEAAVLGGKSRVLQSCMRLCTGDCSPLSTSIVFLRRRPNHMGADELLASWYPSDRGRQLVSWCSTSCRCT